MSQRLTHVRDKALAHLEMMRPYTVFHSGLVAIAGAVLTSAGHAALWRITLAALVTMCGWVAGLYADDYYDREIDARSKPARPVPSGRVSPREAFTTMVALIGVGYLASLALGLANLILAVATTALGIAYSKTFKARAILGNFDRGVLGVCAVAFGALAAGDVLAPGVVLLAGVVFFHDSGTNLVGALRDVEGDRAAGCRTVPVVYGPARAVAIAAGLALAWLALTLVLVALLRPHLLALGLFATAVVLALLVYGALWRARGRVTRPLALRAHKVLVVERLVLLSAFIAAFVPAGAALGLLAATLAATLAAQAWLRDRAEQEQIVYPPAGQGAVSR